MTARALMRKEPATALLVGGLLGGGAALLLAPRSGRQLREGMKALASEARDYAQCYASRARDTAVSTVQKGRHYIVGSSELVTGTLKAGWKASLEEWRQRAKRL